MAQTIKIKVRTRILNASKKLFARNGFEGTSMDMIAIEADISVGNLYHYFKNKRELFEALIPCSAAEKLIKALTEKFAESAGRPAGSSEDFLRLNSDLISLIISSREDLLILFTGSEGTVLEQYTGLFTKSLTDLAESYRRSMPGGKRPLSDTRNAVISHIYRSLTMNIARIVYAFDNPESLAEGLHAVLDYHFFGIGRVLLPHTDGTDR